MYVIEHLYTGRGQEMVASAEISGARSEDSILEVLVWAAAAERAEALVEALAGPGRAVRSVLDEAELAQTAYRRAADVLVVESAPALAVQSAFLRIPLILLRPADDRPAHELARHAYAIVSRPAEAALALDRLIEHRRLAQNALTRREPPRRCSRCGRGYDPAAGRKAPSRRFVRFGQVTLCGSCVSALRTLLDHSDAPWVDAAVGPGQKAS